MTASGPFSNEAPDANKIKASDSDALKHNLPHPLTPRGIATYATADRIFFTFTLALFAIICSVAVCIMMKRCLIQPINAAVERLPQQGCIANGRLEWFTNETTILIETRSLSIHVNPTDEEPIADGADLQIVFAKDKLLLRSLLGWLAIPYPKMFYFPLNLKELWTSWGAYKNSIIPAVFVISVFSLLLVWWMLAWIYSIPVSLIANILKRKVDAVGVFRISVMSQMLAAGIMAAGIVFYAYARIDLTTLCIIFAIHLPFAWIYLAITPFFLPKIPDETYNPFKQEADSTPTQR